MNGYVYIHIYIYMYIDIYMKIKSRASDQRPESRSKPFCFCDNHLSVVDDTVSCRNRHRTQCMRGLHHNHISVFDKYPERCNLQTEASWQRFLTSMRTSRLAVRENNDIFRCLSCCHIKARSKLFVLFVCYIYIYILFLNLKI